MQFDRNKFVALCLGVILLLVSASAMAATQTTTTAIKFAREVGANNLVYTMPAGSIVTRNMSVIRSVAQDFFVDVTLVGGATFATGTLPSGANLTVTNNPGTTFVISIVSGGTNGSTTVRYFVDVTVLDMATLGVITLDTSGWTIKDPTNVLGGGGTYSIQMNTSDAATNVPFDIGNDTATYMMGAFGVAAGPLVSTTAVIDVATNRKFFVPTAPDTTTVDEGATLGFDNSVASVYQQNGTLYSLVNASKINLVFAGDLSGIVGIVWNPLGAFGGVPYAHTITAAERTAGTFTIALAGDDGAIANINAVPIWTVIDGTTIQNARTLTVTANLVLSGGSDGPAANNRNLVPTGTLTTWTLNGTILLANFANGNNAVWNARFYLWNPAATGGNVTARVFTLPLIGGANAQIGTAVSLGPLAARGGLNVRLAEDILTPAGITLPYTTNGGNVVVEFTIEAANCSGWSQVFSGTQFMGIVNLTRIQ